MTTGRLSLGSGTFGREIDEEMSWRLLDYGMEQDITLLDTAEAYGGGNSQAGRSGDQDPQADSLKSRPSSSFRGNR